MFQTSAFPHAALHPPCPPSHTRPLTSCRHRFRRIFQLLLVSSGCLLSKEEIDVSTKRLLHGSTAPIGNSRTSIKPVSFAVYPFPTSATFLSFLFSSVHPSHPHFHHREWPARRS